MLEALCNTPLLHIDDLAQSIQLVIFINLILQLSNLSHREAPCPQIIKLERIGAGTYTHVCVTPNPEPSIAPPYTFLPD